MTPVSFAKSGGRITAWARVGADLLTPVSAYLRIRGGGHGFLFESVEGGERVGRYSFMGTNPSAVFRGTGDRLEERRGGRIAVSRGNPLDLLQKRFRFTPPAHPSLPRFDGGLVGWATYDAVRYMEDLRKPAKDDLEVPELYFFLQDTVLVFDHVRHAITIIAHADIRGSEPDARARAAAAIRAIERRLATPAGGIASVRAPEVPRPPAGMKPNMSRAKFLANVMKAKRYIRIGDVIQVVLSQRFSTPFAGDPFSIYRALRGLNPSPYMFFVETPEGSLAGASPEMLVRLEGDVVETRPIAGTRPRGKTPAHDLALEKELRADPKERAEHVMLVDLGRNDLGRVCRYGSVRVEDDMIVERYSHVMHLVSGVKGRMLANKDAFDALRAVFPAGTVSGAPKVRAMQVIDELEPTRRGPYAGIVGYIAHSGNMDTAIAFRMILVKNGMAYQQSGMGIVADSVPAKEYQESLAKSRAALLAVAAAQEADR